MKTCTCCDSSKPVAEFPLHSYKRVDGSRAQRTHCKECDAEALLANKYSMTRLEFQKFRASANGKCAICEQVPSSETYARFRHTKLAVDHDHATGKVRGMLCYNCNHGLGKFKDSPARLAAAIVYLQQ